MSSFTVSVRLGAPPSDVYAAWLDPERHGAMTGSPATVDGDRFTAWEGYIEGTYGVREPGRRIEMTWRTADFADGEGDARVVVELHPDGEGTRLVLTQSDTPERLGDRYVSGWEEFYFEAMKGYFG